MRFVLPFICVTVLLSTCVVAKELSYSRTKAKLCRTTCRSLEKKHDIKWIGQGGGLRGAVNEVEHTFKVLRPLTKDEARVIIVDCTEEILKSTKENEEDGDFLVKHSLSQFNVTVSLLVSNPDLSDVVYPLPFQVTVHCGRVCFYYVDFGTWRKFSCDKKEAEPYEEALTLVRGEAGQEKTRDSENR